MNAKTEIKLSGVGGQGVVLAGTIIGCAASVYDRKNAVQTKEYGSELRGGDVSTGVIVSTEKIIFPSVTDPDVLVALAQQACDAHLRSLKPGGILITDSGLVTVDEGALPEGARHYSAPFNATADSAFGSNGVLNMIMLGFFAAAIGAVSIEGIRQAVAYLVPPRTRKQNLEAVEKGVELASEIRSR